MQLLSYTISILYFAIYLLVGQLASHVIFAKERALVRTWLGGVAALAMLLWLPALCSFLLGFTVYSQALALIICAVLGVCCFQKARGTPLAAFSFRLEWPTFLTLLPFLIVGIYLFLTHTIRPENGALHVGQSTFGDLSLHLGLATSIAEQGFFPPEYSIFPGTMVGYPFLCDSISSTFLVLGAPLRFSMLLPSIFAYVLVLLGVYLFFERWLGARRIAIFATLLFFLGGGFGFTYFFDLAKETPGNFQRIFEAFYQTPTNNVEMGVKWVNPIADMLIPQRATLFGWALLFPALYMLRRAAFEDEREWFIPLGVLAGCMPLVHTHSFLALGIVSGVYLFRALWQRTPFARSWLWYALLAIGLAAPQLLLFTFKQSAGSGFLQPHFNWANEKDSFLWFYIKNLGLLFLLLPAAYFRLEKKERQFYLGAIAIWFLAEFIQFQPNAYDNNKLLFVWFAYTCGIIAKLLLAVYRRLATFPGRRYLAFLTCTAIFLSGILTLGREWKSDFELFYADEVEAADFINTYTSPDSLFLTATNHSNAVSSLTGRNILCGTGSYLYFHGLDYMEREQHVRLLFEQPETYFPALSQTYGLDYVFLSDTEKYTYQCNSAYFEKYPVVFQNRSVLIYDVRSAALSPAAITP